MRHAATDCGHGEVPIFDGDSKRIPVNLRIRYAHAICGFYSGEIRSNSSASFDGLVRSTPTLVHKTNEIDLTVGADSWELDAAIFEGIALFENASANNFALIWL